MSFAPLIIRRRRGMRKAGGLDPAACLALPLLFATLFVDALRAEDTFEQPQAYSVERYQAGWEKNPFTLKTAPVSLERSSFAEDLAIGTFYGKSDHPTIVVVNTKTKERFPLSPGVEAKNGMVLRSYSIQPARRDTTAVVALGDETAELRFDDAFIRQSSAEAATGDPAKQPAAPPNQPQYPPQIPPGVVPTNAANPGVPLNAGVPPSAQRPFVPPGSGAAAYTPTTAARRRVTLPSSQRPVPVPAR